MKEKLHTSGAMKAPWRLSRTSQGGVVRREVICHPRVVTVCWVLSPLSLQVPSACFPSCTMTLEAHLYGPHQRGSSAPWLLVGLVNGELYREERGGRCCSLLWPFEGHMTCWGHPLSVTLSCWARSFEVELDPKLCEGRCDLCLLCSPLYPNTMEMPH